MRAGSCSRSAQTFRLFSNSLRDSKPRRASRIHPFGKVGAIQKNQDRRKVRTMNARMMVLGLLVLTAVVARPVHCQGSGTGSGSGPYQSVGTGTGTGTGNTTGS